MRPSKTIQEQRIMNKIKWSAFWKEYSIKFTVFYNTIRQVNKSDVIVINYIKIYLLLKRVLQINCNLSTTIINQEIYEWNKEGNSYSAKVSQTET